MIIKAFWDCFYWSNRSFQINAETWTAERVKAVKNKQVKVKAGCFLFSVSSNKKNTLQRGSITYSEVKNVGRQSSLITDWFIKFHEKLKKAQSGNKQFEV